MLFSAFPFGGAGVTFIALPLAVKCAEMWETLHPLEMQYIAPLPQKMCVCLIFHFDVDKE